MDGHFIFSIFQTIVFMAPVLMIIFNHGKDKQKLETMVVNQKEDREIINKLVLETGKDRQRLEEVIRDVNGLGEKVSDIRDDQSGALSELNSRMANMNETLIKVTVVMDYIKKDVEELNNKKE